MIINMENKVELWKNKLLDLGKKNKLISYHETKRSTLSIKIPAIFNLWNSFVKNEKPLEFPYCEDIDDINETFENLELEWKKDTSEEPKIVTNQNIKDLQKTLRNLRNKSKTASAEQGIHILHLAFGFLEWTETENSKNYIYSPLILVPVTLTVESISSPYILELADDEIVFNPALKYKLENDFGLSLPEFDEDNDLEDYFNTISKLIEKNKWKVNQRVELSLFSFLKINMYNDLEIHKNSIVSNQIIRAISGDATAVVAVPDSLENFNFDENQKPIDTFQVLDADSSQQDAILLAKRGVSFVLQGPPGTGKSQTITNIISECLADNKKVLFVSEKMAALDVVYRRLSSASLNDFCLVLHSHKTNKKAVLEQLRIVLNFAKTKAQLSDEAYIRLNTLYNDKEKLNEYANQLFDTVMPLNKTIYEVNGILANLEKYDDVIFHIKDVRGTTYEQYNAYLYVLNKFKNTVGGMSEDYNSNPWQGACVENVTNELRHDVGAKFPKLSQNLKDYDIELQNMFSNLNLNLSSSYNTLLILQDIFYISKNSPCIPYHWITKNELD